MWGGGGSGEVWTAAKRTTLEAKRKGVAAGRVARGGSGEAVKRRDTYY